MIVVISGSVGSGKTSFADELGKMTNFEVVHLGEWAEEFKIKDQVQLQTFDFDIDLLLDKIEKKMLKWTKGNKNMIIESHFAHFINHKFVDYLFIINRDVKELKKEYKKREYNNQKMKDNLEVESFNLCFYEALENGYEEENKVFCLENSSTLTEMVKKTLKKIENQKF